MEPPIQENKLEMPIGVVEAATENFSFSNKIGEGGFGPVYKVLFNFFQTFFAFEVFLDKPKAKL